MLFFLHCMVGAISSSIGRTPNCGKLNFLFRFFFYFTAHFCTSSRQSTYCPYKKIGGGHIIAKHRHDSVPTCKFSDLVGRSYEPSSQSGARKSGRRKLKSSKEEDCLSPVRNYFPILPETRASSFENRILHFNTLVPSSHIQILDGQVAHNKALTKELLREYSNGHFELACQQSSLTPLLHGQFQGSSSQRLLKCDRVVLHGSANCHQAANDHGV